jgi:hypothetical protein
MDEFSEAIPFKETRLYVQGIIRNWLQYQRLYDENGKFRAEVGGRSLRAELDAKIARHMKREGVLRGEALAVPPALSDRLMDYGILPEESK